MKKVALTESGHKNIIKAVVVIIGNCDAHSVKTDRQPRFGCNVRKFSVAVVVIQLQGRFSVPMPWPVLAVDQENVGIAVVIVIYERATGAERFGKILASECPVVVNKTDSGRLRDVGKPNSLTWLAGDGQPRQ